MTREEVGRALGINPRLVESIERTAFRKIRRRMALKYLVEDLLAEVDKRAEADDNHQVKDPWARHNFRTRGFQG